MTNQQQLLYNQGMKTEEYKYFTEKFNSKPKHERSKMIPFLLQEQIAGMEREKLRLKRSYERNLKEINSTLKNLNKELNKCYLSTEFY